jgi:hypothetical protein
MGQFFLVAYRHQPIAHGQSWSSGDFASNGVSQSHLLIMSIVISLSHFQFWSAYVGCTTQYKDAISKTWEQIDVVHRMVEANPATFEFVTSAQGPHLLVYKVWNVKIDFLSLQGSRMLSAKEKLEVSSEWKVDIPSTARWPFFA